MTTPQDIQAALLPCPFCDVKPIVVDGIDGGTQKETPGHGTIICENDLCGVNPSVDYYNGFDQGLTVWNTRAQSPAPVHDAIKNRAFIEGFQTCMNRDLPVQDAGDLDRSYLEQLHKDLVSSHISALLSPEKMPKKEWYEAAGFVRQTCVRAANSIQDILDRLAHALRGSRMTRRGQSNGAVENRRDQRWAVLRCRQ